MRVSTAAAANLIRVLVKIFEHWGTEARARGSAA